MTILGTVDIRDFDLGCFLSLGAELSQFVIDGESRNQYVVEVPGVDTDLERFQGKIPVFFDAPEDPYQDFILPSFVFRKNDYTPAYERQPLTGTVARAPAPGAEKIVLANGMVGWSAYVEQLRGDPYDITYDLTIHGRRAMELNRMLKFVMVKMRPPWFCFKVIDSLGDVRYYDAGEMSFSNTSELADIADRTQSSTVSFTVRAEIDTWEDVPYSSMYDPRLRVQSGVEGRS